MAAVELWNTSLWNDANLKAYYRLNDTSDNTPSPTYTLTNNNTVAFNAAMFGNGADFSSSNTNKTLTTTNNLGVSGTNAACTIMLWAKLYAEISSGIEGHISLGDATGAWLFQIYYNYNGGTRQIVFNRQTVNSANNTVSSNATLGTTWHHIALTYNGTTLTGYLDGTSAGTLATSGSGTGASNKFIIGETDANLFSGLIDDVAVFSRALSSTEISNYYNGLLGPATGHATGGFFLAAQ